MTSTSAAIFSSRFSSGGIGERFKTLPSCDLVWSSSLLEFKSCHRSGASHAYISTRTLCGSRCHQLKRHKWVAEATRKRPPSICCLLTETFALLRRKVARSRSSADLQSAITSDLGCDQERHQNAATLQNHCAPMFLCWASNEASDWRKQTLCLLAALCLLLGTLETPEEAAAMAPHQNFLDTALLQSTKAPVKEDLGAVVQFVAVNMPESNSPDVGQTSLFSAENEDLAADLFEVRVFALFFLWQKLLAHYLLWPKVSQLANSKRISR
jgi:hypothetical protein